MTTIAEVRETLAECAATIPGWAGSTYVGNVTTSGVIVVSRPPFDPRFVFSGAATTAVFRMVAYASATTPEASQQQLDALCEQTGTGSLIAAVQTAANWAYDIDYAQVIECGEVALTQFGEDAEQFLACPFQVEVCW